MKPFLRVALYVAATVACTPHVFAQEYFGDFLDPLKGVFDPIATPRPTFQIENEFRFRDPNGLLWATPAGSKVDGASIPTAFWSVIGGPFEGAYINASVIHDHYCRTKERTAHDTHRNFYYGMRALQVPEWKATLMHWAVSTFGPSWKLEKRVVMEQSCSSATGPGITCTSVPTTQDVLVASPGVDLSDPEVLAAAISKTNAVAKTLLTSNGKVLDVVPSGVIPATPANVQASSDSYRRVFATKEFTTSPGRLGLLSQTGSNGLANIQPWVGNRIPRFTDAVTLTPQSAPSLRENTPFRLDDRSKDLLRDRVDVRSLRSTTHLEIRTQ